MGRSVYIPIRSLFCSLLLAGAVLFGGARAMAQNQQNPNEEELGQDQQQQQQANPSDYENRYPDLVECRNGRTPDGKCKPPEMPDARRKTTEPAQGEGENGDQTRGRQAGQEPATRTGRVPLYPRERPEPKNDFQKFVEATLGKPLPLFGLKLFDRVPSTFAPADQIPVTSDYAIGPGDQLLVRAWGQVNIDYSVTVDRNGAVYIPDVGTINVAGIKYSQLHDYMKSAISRVYRDFDLSVTLGQLRSIQVLVVGQARRPGNYTVSALSTMVNALFASGGPSSNGSMRHIQLKRGDRVISEFDLYDLLLRGDKSKDMPLQNGDVIFVPPIGSLVAVSGAVNVPAIYEIKDKTNLGDVLRLAGGLGTTAEGNRVTVQRIVDHDVRHMDQFALDTDGLARPVSDGDIIGVAGVLPRFDNAITLRGNVARPGRYPWHEGMRVKDLIPSREALVLPEFWETRNAKALVTEKTGEKTLRTEVKRDAAEINWDYAVISRLNLDDLTTKLVPFNLGQAIADPESPENQALRANDVITIFSQNDFPVPVAKRSIFVRLEGEFTHGGVYQVQPGERLADVVNRIGGFTPNAYVYGTAFTRESVRESQQIRLKELVDRMDADLQAAILGQLQRTTGTPDSAQLLDLRIQNQRIAIQRLRQVEVTGRIALDLRPTDTTISALPDLALEDGDVISVPARPATVTVLGAVFSQGDLIYRQNATVDQYINEAGGPTKDADNKRVYVIRANGIVRSKQGHPGWAAGSFGNLRLMPGDAIIVPTDLTKTPLITQIKDWSTIFANFALGAAGAKVLLGF